MEPDGQNIISNRFKIEIFLLKILIIIMIVLINNNCINSYATMQESDENYELEDTINVFKLINDNLINSLNIKIKGYAIKIEDNTFGYVESEEKREEILKDVCNKYIDELDIENKCVVKIDVRGRLEATPEKIRLSELSRNNEIVNEVYDACVTDRDLLNLELKISSYDTVEFEPNIVVENDPNLYMGTSERINGSKGKKIVYKEETYSGLTKVDENILNENIVVEAVPTVIKNGTKNPYYDGVAFLSRPTIGGYMTSSYGEVRGSTYHKGIDIAKDTGEDVYASLGGKVISAGYNNGGYGNLIIVDHGNNIKTYYAHLNEIYVSEGDYIDKGNIIGTIGSTGYSTGPHLHFELRINNTPVNPINYIL